MTKRFRHFLIYSPDFPDAILPFHIAVIFFQRLSKLARSEFVLASKLHCGDLGRIENQAANSDRYAQNVAAFRVKVAKLRQSQALCVNAEGAAYAPATAAGGRLRTLGCRIWTFYLLKQLIRLVTR